jgi:hypothetical protein
MCAMVVLFLVIAMPWAISRVNMLTERETAAPTPVQPDADPTVTAGGDRLVAYEPKVPWQVAASPTPDALPVAWQATPRRVRMPATPAISPIDRASSETRRQKRDDRSSTSRDAMGRSSISFCRFVETVTGPAPIGDQEYR